MNTVAHPRLCGRIYDYPSHNPIGLLWLGKNVTCYVLCTRKIMRAFQFTLLRSKPETWAAVATTRNTLLRNAKSLHKQNVTSRISCTHTTVQIIVRTLHSRIGMMVRISLSAHSITTVLTTVTNSQEFQAPRKH